MKKINALLLLSLMALLSSCGTYFNQPISQETARLGEYTRVSKLLSSLPEPESPVVVGVYNFRDQTGQFKPTENGSTFSTAVTQGGTAILLKALEDSNWFLPTERENLNNLLNERQIIKSTRDEYAKVSGTVPERLKPLLFAGVLLEGGIVSYDTNIVTGGIGARYFGIGGSSKYRQDRVTVYLRAVSTSTGEILKTVYVSKTILSQALDANYFRFVSFQRLLEAETGFTKNEPVQLAITEAIEKAVHSLIVEGISDDLWFPKQGLEDETRAILNDYYEEKTITQDTKLYNRLYRDRRGKSVVSIAGGASIIDGDLANSNPEFYGKIGYKHYLNPYLNINASLNQFNLSNGDVFSEAFTSLDFNAEFTILPFDNFTPYLYSGFGANGKNSLDEIDLKVQYGVGLEYLVSDKLGLTIFGEHNLTFSDEIDNVISGKRDDFYFRVGLGVNFYLNPPTYEKTKERKLKRLKDEDLRLLRNANIEAQNGKKKKEDKTKNENEKDLKELRKANIKAQKENNKTNNEN